jgi:hypothetical protein
VSTWCSLLSADGETVLDVGISLGPSSVRGGRVDVDAQRGARAALLARLSPFGYRELKFKRRGKRPTGCILQKTLRGLAAARRERARLDEVVFGE